MRFRSLSFSSSFACIAPSQWLQRGRERQGLAEIAAMPRESTDTHAVDAAAPPPRFLGPLRQAEVLRLEFRQLQCLVV